MRKPVLHLICNAHLDPVWQWRWEEGAAEAINTYAIAVRLLRKYPDFVFNHNESILYRWVRTYDPQFNYLRHMVLMYGEAGRPWTAEAMKYTVAHLDRDAVPDDWLFDSFLFLNVKASSGNDYCADINLGTTMAGEGDFFATCSPRPAAKADWEEFLEFTLGEQGAVDTLNQAIEQAASRLGSPPPRKRNVVLMLPYPHVTQGDFGRIPGHCRLSSRRPRHAAGPGLTVSRPAG